MPAAVWWTIAIVAMVGMFAACVIAVSVGLRLFENALARRRRRLPE
jgi:hypothetical protein